MTKQQHIEKYGIESWNAFVEKMKIYQKERFQRLRKENEIEVSLENKFYDITDMYHLNAKTLYNPITKEVMRRNKLFEPNEKGKLFFVREKNGCMCRTTEQIENKLKKTIKKNIQNKEKPIEKVKIKKRMLKKYDSEGLLLKTYKTLGELVNDGYNAHFISLYVNGDIRHKPYGFIWRYELTECEVEIN